MAEYLEDFKLPSKGIYYENKLSTVNLRPIKVKEEKMLFGSSSPKVMDSIIRACVTSPKDLDIGMLMPQDKFFLMFNLRLISLGNEYKVNFRCVNCDKKNEEYEIDLSKIPVIELDDDAPAEVVITLSNKDKVNIRQLSSNELDTITEKSKERLRKFPKSTVEEHEHMFRLMRSIASINGEEKNMTFLETYVNDLIMKDSNAILNAINKYEFGVDTRLSLTCPYCEAENYMLLPITNEFFRPSRRV